MTLLERDVELDSEGARNLPDDVLQIILEGDFSGVFQKAMFDIELDEHNFFIQQTTPDGEPWATLAPSTIKRKGHSRILIDSGRMASSVASGSIRTGGDSIREIINEGANKGFSFGTSVPYAGYHQDGTSRIPQREFLGFTEERIEEISNDFLNRAVELLIGGE